MSSLVFAVILGYPLIAYSLFDRIVPAAAFRRRRTILMLTTSTSVVFLVGVWFGLFFLSKFYILGVSPHFLMG